MYIKHYTAVPQRVPDPLKPNRTVLLKQMTPSGAHTISDGGKVYRADDNGWFDVPEDVGVRLSKYHQNGGGFLVPGAVPEDPAGQPVPREVATSKVAKAVKAVASASD